MMYYMMLVGLLLGLMLGVAAARFGHRLKRRRAKRYAFTKRVNGSKYYWGWTRHSRTGERQENCWQPLSHRAYRFSWLGAQRMKSALEGCSLIQMQKGGQHEPV